MKHIARKVVFWCLLFLSVWGVGLALFIGQIPIAPTSDDSKSDVIIVFTGGSERLSYGLTLLAKGKGDKLFITGVAPDVSMADILRHAPGNYRAQLEAMAKDDIILGRQAVNTIGNAEEVQMWLESQNVKTVRLVTANYHMPRSIEELEDTTEGLTIIPEPVFPDDFSLNGWWHNNSSRTLLLLEYHKFIASKLRHWLLSVTHHK